MLSPSAPLHITAKPRGSSRHDKSDALDSTNARIMPHAVTVERGALDRAGPLAKAEAFVCVPMRASSDAPDVLVSASCARKRPEVHPEPNVWPMSPVVAVGCHDRSHGNVVRLLETVQLPRHRGPEPKSETLPASRATSPDSQSSPRRANSYREIRLFAAARSRLLRPKPKGALAPVQMKDRPSRQSPATRAWICVTYSPESLVSSYDLKDPFERPDATVLPPRRHIRPIDAFLWSDRLTVRQLSILPWTEVQARTNEQHGLDGAGGERHEPRRASVKRPYISTTRTNRVTGGPPMGLGTLRRL
jgi:hypothetical protein